MKLEVHGAEIARHRVASRWIAEALGCCRNLSSRFQVAAFPAATDRTGWFPDRRFSGVLREKAVELEISNETLTLFHVTADDFNDVEAVFGDLRSYSDAIGADGSPADAANEFMITRPPSTQVRDKHSFIAFREGHPVGLLDAIDGYPISGTVFIGLLAVRESLHGTEIGRALYRQAETFIRDDLGALRIRIAVVENNAVGGFWKQMGSCQPVKRNPMIAVHSSLDRS